MYLSISFEYADCQPGETRLVRFIRAESVDYLPAVKSVGKDIMLVNKQFRYDLALVSDIRMVVLTGESNAHV